MKTFLSVVRYSTPTFFLVNLFFTASASEMHQQPVEVFCQYKMKPTNLDLLQIFKYCNKKKIPKLT